MSVHTPGTGWALTLREAAERCEPSVSRRTLVRRLERDAFPNAYRDTGAKGPGSGPWLIPVADLQAAGYVVRAEVADVAEVASSDGVTELLEAAERIAQLEGEVRGLRDRLELTQLLADERGAERDRLAQLLLGPGTTEQGPAPSSSTPSSSVADVTKRTGWLSRLRRQ